MKRVALITIVVCFYSSLSAQKDSTIQRSDKDEKRLKIYKTWISLNNESKTVKGVLYSITDSSLLVSTSLVKEDYTNGNFQTTTLNFKNIDLVKTRSKNRVLKGALIGTVSGFFLGAIIGFIEGDDNPDEVLVPSTAAQNALGNGVVLAIGGAGIGTLCGLIKIKIPINGSMSNFNSNKRKLAKYAIR
jgi:hypothetical protein